MKVYFLGFVCVALLLATTVLERRIVAHNRPQSLPCSSEVNARCENHHVPACVEVKI